jgi:hypothetical protein
MATETRSLHRKLAQIMYEAERIPKNGRAPKEMGGYKFVQVGDAADYIRKALAENVITMMPTGVQVVGQADRPTKSGGTMTTVDLITTWTLTDGETGETIDIQSFGAGADGGDKYSGKASTSAMKYALLTGFLLSTGEDSELGNTEAGAPQPKSDATPARSVVEAEGGLIGVASKGTSAPVDGEIRQTPDGSSVGFVIGEGREKVQVVAYGLLADTLAVVLPEIIGQRVQVYGPVSPETMKVRGRDITFNRVRLERLVAPDMTLPAPEPIEAPSVPLFDEAEQEAIFAAVDKAGAA